MFFKTRVPIEPVEFVRRICEDAMASSERKTGRFVKRLTPMTLMGKATEKGLEEVSAKVLAPHFHAEGSVGKKARVSTRYFDMFTDNTTVCHQAEHTQPQDDDERSGHQDGGCRCWAWAFG